MRVCVGAVCVCLLLNACAPTPPRIDLDVPFPGHWRNSPSATSKETGISDTWWRSLGDPVLNESVELALKQNLTLAQASERLLAARSLEKATLANQRPRLDFVAGPDNITAARANNAGDTGSRTTGAYIAGFDMNWELPLFHRGEAERSIARAKIDSAGADFAESKTSIAAEVVRTYGELRAARKRRQALAGVAQNDEILYAMLKRARHAGLIGQEGEEAAYDRLVDARQAEQLADVDKESAIQRLMVLCGLTMPLSAWAHQQDDAWSFSHPALPAPAIPAQLIRRRPDVKIAEAAVLEAAGEAGIARADLYPKLAIEGVLMLVGNVSGVSRTSDTIAMLAPSAHVPLLDWGLGRDVVDARDAQLREAILAYRQTVLKAIEETENAFSRFKAADGTLAQEDELATRKHALVASARRAYQAGMLSKRELLRLENQALERDIQHVASQATWFTTFALWNKVQAIIDDADTKQISNG